MTDRIERPEWLDKITPNKNDADGPHLAAGRYALQLERDNAALTAERDRLRQALESITELRGVFSTDRLTHATNVIENTVRIARAALTPPAPQPEPKVIACPRCHGKGAYYKNIMLDVALCSCRSAGAQGDQQ